jgi:hypothetical protein
MKSHWLPKIAAKSVMKMEAAKLCLMMDSCLSAALGKALDALLGDERGEAGDRSVLWEISSTLTLSPLRSVIDFLIRL